MPPKEHGEGNPNHAPKKTPSFFPSLTSGARRLLLGDFCQRLQFIRRQGSVSFEAAISMVAASNASVVRGQGSYLFESVLR
ncbi:hypothetical protein JTE90_005968 [Oedothorax gibbosus]|uniref:Uncharacterized protein n=1 Tax=Oedothorax gibbosus TaxID=931172 RepID=A0AAV6UXQ2_9ARAC|nr:hypothetical protein JTE90_005968 [Oedothorax gibbosus]